MTINKADVYRKAAEVIVRDGKTEGALTSKGDGAEAVKDTSLPVCALGACARAEWELYGTLPHLDAWEEVNAYDKYVFRVPWESPVTGTVRPRTLPSINDDPSTSAEEVVDV